MGTKYIFKKNLWQTLPYIVVSPIVSWWCSSHYPTLEYSVGKAIRSVSPLYLRSCRFAIWLMIKNQRGPPFFDTLTLVVKYFSTSPYIHNALRIITPHAWSEASFLFFLGLSPPIVFRSRVITHGALRPRPDRRDTAERPPQKSGTHNEPHLRYTVTNDERGRWREEHWSGRRREIHECWISTTKPGLDWHTYNSNASNGYTLPSYIYSQFLNYNNIQPDRVLRHWWLSYNTQAAPSSPPLAVRRVGFLMDEREESIII